jgi:MoxR-like ATPase
MPSDVTGTPIFNMQTQEFRFHAGPVFTQLLLADEINRAPAKTHAALLETMQEYRVTVDSQVHPMARPFFVLATQNPIESEGTYNLPEAQLDRFMFQLRMDYPSLEEETSILKLHGGQADIDDQLSDLVRVTSPEEILQFTKATEQVRVEEVVIQYIANVVRQSRHWPQIHLGASPRAGITLMRAARTLAMFAGRDFVVPDDIAHLYRPALRHRIILTPEAEVEGFDTDQVLADVLRSVDVPRMN